MCRREGNYLVTWEGCTFIVHPQPILCIYGGGIHSELLQQGYQHGTKWIMPHLKQLFSEKHSGSLVTFTSVTLNKCSGKFSKSQGVHSPVNLHPPPGVSGRKSSFCKHLGNSKTSFTLKTLSVHGVTFHLLPTSLVTVIIPHICTKEGECKPKITFTYTF